MNRDDVRLAGWARILVGVLLGGGFGAWTWHAAMGASRDVGGVRVWWEAGLLPVALGIWLLVTGVERVWTSSAGD